MAAPTASPGSRKEAGSWPIQWDIPACWSASRQVSTARPLSWARRARSSWEKATLTCWSFASAEMRPPNRIPLQILLPEAMVCSRFDQESNEQLLSWCDVIVIGPGLGTSVASREREQWFLTAAAREKKPLILDADGLNLLAAHPQWYQYLGEHVVLTPHIGEMSRLSGRTIQEIQHEIADTALKCAAETGSVCVLKDACTVIADEKGQMYLNLSGNSGMATAGSGDVLSGILAAVLCMYLKTEEQPPMVLKAALGVYLHGLCGDLAAAEKGKRSMLAGDIIEYLPRALAIGEEESEL